MVIEVGTEVSGAEVVKDLVEVGRWAERRAKSGVWSGRESLVEAARWRSAGRPVGQKKKKNGVRFNLDDYKIRAAFTFAPVWCAHAKYKTEDGDPIPRTFGRHPTTHAVSRAQYSRINAVMGLMLVRSVIKFFNTEME